MNKLFLTAFLVSSTLIVYGQDSLKRFNGCEIKIDNRWIKQDQGTPPLIQDSVSFDQAIISTIAYPYEALRMGVEGDVVFTIEIDATGEMTRGTIVQDIGAGTNATTAMVLNALPANWTPATYNHSAVESRVTILIKFHLGEMFSFRDSGAHYKSYLVMAIGNRRWRTVNTETLIKVKKKKAKK